MRSVMITFRVLVLLAAVTCQGADLNMKRNRRVQKLAQRLISSQRAYDREVQSWADECAGKGLVLSRVADNLMDCMLGPTPKPAPKPPAVKKEAK